MFALALGPGRRCDKFSRVKSAARIRIVSLAPSATSILESIGAMRCVVGVSKWCGDVADVGARPVLGDCWALDPDEVMALRPTLVIGSVPFKAETVAKLLERPITFLAKNPRSLADIYSDMTLLGIITGREGAAGKVVRGMKKSLAVIRRKYRRSRRPRVYCEAWPNPRISSPPWVAELVSIAGGRFVLPSGARLKDEQVAQAAPQVIVLAWTALGGKSKPETALKNPVWQNIPAIRRNRVYAVRDEWLNTPSPVLVYGARELARVIHA